MMRHEHILNVEGNNLAGVSGELDVDIDAIFHYDPYVISYLVIGSSGRNSDLT